MSFGIMPFVEPNKIFVTVMIAMVGIPRPAAAEGVRMRLEKAVEVLSKLTASSDSGLSPKDLTRADCVVIVPGFYRGAAIKGEIFEGGLLLEVSFGRGFITCRDGDVWSAPGAITLVGGSLSAQIGETVNIVILSMDKQLRSNVLSEQFVIGRDAPAAWGEPDTANARSKILLFGSSTPTFAGFDLDGAALKSDDSVNRRLYQRTIKIREIVKTRTTIPAVAQALISKLTSLTLPIRRGCFSSSWVCVSESVRPASNSRAGQRSRTSGPRQTREFAEALPGDALKRERTRCQSERIRGGYVVFVSGSIGGAISRAEPASAATVT